MPIIDGCRWTMSFSHWILIPRRWSTVSECTSTSRYAPKKVKCQSYTTKRGICQSYTTKSGICQSYITASTSDTIRREQYRSFGEEYRTRKKTTFIFTWRLHEKTAWQNCRNIHVADRGSAKSSSRTFCAGCALYGPVAAVWLPKRWQFEETRTIVL